MASDPYRLPRGVLPRRYELTLAPDLAAARFSGEARIHVDVVEPTDVVVCNGAELDILQASFEGEDGALLPGAVTLDAETEQVRIALPAVAAAGRWTLHCTFTGVLNDKLRGFYRSRFVDADGVEQVQATTQFESTDARRAFPCWDEPDLKAVFAVSLVVDEGLTAISNTAPVSTTAVGGGKVQVDFADTIVMSTYLVAFVVGRLEVTDPVDAGGTPLRLACVPGKRHLSDYAVRVGDHALRFFSEYFGIAYPGDKMDFVAVPDFASGAMENLGAVTYRESVLLVDPAVASHVELERVADVVCHEVAHMWFGDLVTMKWWNGIWLNEAFATMMELLAVDAFAPEWQRWVTFGTTRGHAMVTDGLASTRPIEFPVVRPEEAEGMFDLLTYQKGSGILRMLEQYVGAEPFRQGIARYLERHSYDNAETADLWAALTEATDQPVGPIMDTWILQGGHPVVSVESADDDCSVTLSQRHFRYRGTGDGRWNVPVLVRAVVHGREERRRVLLADDLEPVRVAFDGPVDFVVVNAGGWGPYRVRYDGGLLRRLTAELGDLEPLERFNLVADTWASVLAGATPVEDFLELASLLGGERNPSVWIAVIEALEQLSAVVDGADRPAFETFVQRLLRPPFEAVGWTATAGEAETVGTTRGYLLRALGTLGNDGAVRDRARGLHDRYLRDASSIDADVAGPLPVVLACEGNVADYDRFEQQWRQARTPQEEIRYLYALGQFRDVGLVGRTLDLVLTEVRSQNAPFLVKYLLENAVGGPEAWGWVKANWDALAERLPNKTMHRMVDGIRWLCTPDLSRDVTEFLASHPVPAEQRSIDQAVELLEVLVAFGARERDRLGPLFRALST